MYFFKVPISHKGNMVQFSGKIIFLERANDYICKSLALFMAAILLNTLLR